MSIATFVVKSTLRNKKRTLLSALSIGFSLFLLFSMQTFVTYLAHPPRAKEGDLRLIVAPTTSMMDSLPMAYMDRIEEIDHVVGVSPFALFPSRWKDDPRNTVRAIGVKPERIWKVFPDIQVAPEVKEAMLKVRTGAIVGNELMAANGWKVGDRIVLNALYSAADAELQILGEFHWTFRSNMIFFNYDYYSDLRDGYNRTSMFWIMADSAESVPGIKEDVDALFHNSNAETRTEPEKVFVLNMLSSLGNIQLLMGSLAGVIVFTMLLIMGSNIALTMRERTREVGMLKSIGFPWHWVLMMLLGEAGFITLMGAAIAAVLSFAMVYAPMQKMTGGLIGSFMVAPATLAITLAGGLALGIVSALPPTLAASRMNVIQAMRRTD